MRVSIDKINQTYLTQLSCQMECFGDTSYAINYILTELRRINYSFHAQINLNVATSLNAISPLQTQPIQPSEYPQSGLVPISNDPVINRLAKVLEDF